MAVPEAEPWERAKRRLRRELRAQRAEVPGDEAARAGEAAARVLLAEGRIRGAARVALYAALPDEVPTRPLFEALARRGVPILFPRCRPDRRLAFAAVAAWEDLRPGHFGVLEPAADEPGVDLDPRDAVIVPGVAYDRAGHRLGRGAGYYDRAFPPGDDARRAPLLVGLAYAFQLVDAVPHGPRDRSVDGVATERGLHWVAQREEARP